jgi:hypothetical protein
MTDPTNPFAPLDNPGWLDPTPDTSPENVARMAKSLRDPFCHNEELCDEAADMLEALAAERDKLNMRAANAERMLTAAEAKLAASEAREDRLREANGILEDALQEVGDDYPGSSCQEWCRNMVANARAVLEGDKP